MSPSRSKLYYSDNLPVLREMGSESVDLVYLDPPFNSKADYNVFFGHGKDRAQTLAFRDTWSWNREHNVMYNEILDDRSGTYSVSVQDGVRGLHKILGSCGMLAYLLYMCQRLVELHRVLRPTGSLYLHCDPTASHYLKVLLDAVFGGKNFVNEVVWDYKKISNAATRKFSRGHDIIFFYWKSNKSTFNPQFEEISERKLQLIRAGYNTKKQDNQRLLYVYDSEIVNKKIKAGTLNLQDFSKVIYVKTDRGAAMRDIFRIDFLNSQSRERLGYPTQKPLSLLELIVKASSNAGDVVLDPFCGCGTTLDAAQGLGRRWIGIDISYLSIDTIKSRLTDRYGKEIVNEFEVLGTPQDMSGAEELLRRTLAKAYHSEPKTLEEAISMAKRIGRPGERHGRNAGRFEFQRWSCSLVDAVPNDREIGDGGVDGKLRWLQVEDGAAREIFGAVEVKSSLRVTPEQVRALKGVLTSGEEYVMGILISLYRSDTEEVRRICADFSDSHWHHYTGNSYPRLQVWSIEQYFAGEQPLLPPALKPYKKAEKDRMRVKQTEY